MMKLTTLSVLVALSCAACSGEDIQLDLEKVKEDASKLVKKQPETRKAEPRPADQNREDREKLVVNKNDEAKKFAFLPESSTKEKPSQDRTSAVALNSRSSELDNSKSATQSDVSLELDQEAIENTEMLKELEASLAQINDAELMAAYQGKSSAIDLQLGGSALTNGSVALAVSKQNLVSNVTSVSGATSITGDPTGFGFTIGLSGDYLFEFDKDALTPKAQEALKSVLTLYKDYEGTSIKVEGHTDSKGSNEYNLDLSKRRAGSVKQWFETSGIDSSLVTTQGYGETKPVAKNTKDGKDNPEGRAQNRRVEIVVKTKKKVNHLPTVSKSSAI